MRTLREKTLLKQSMTREIFAGSITLKLLRSVEFRSVRRVAASSQQPAARVFFPVPVRVGIYSIASTPKTDSWIFLKINNPQRKPSSFFSNDHHTMTTRPLRICLLALLLPASSAWGPDSAKAVFSRGHPLKAKDNHHHEEAVVIEAYRSKLENVFDPASAFHQGEKFAFLREKADAMASETFEGFDTDFGCAIPDEWKKTSKGEAVDVMNFLGIRRAVPLKVSKWE